MAFFHSSFRVGVLTTMAAAALASCVVVEDGPGPGPYPPDRPRPGGPSMCTQQYDPVCGERRGDRQTFGNSCVAQSEGFRIVHGGECRGDRPGRPGGPGYDGPGRPDWDRPGRPDRDRPGRPDRNPGFCTREYAPVCARRGGDVRTFGNSCEARAADYRILGNGEC